MRDRLKRGAFWICERSITASWALYVGGFVASAIQLLPSRLRDTSRDYTKEGGLIGTYPGQRNLNELDLNFLARVQLQRRYNFLIELGAYSGDRALQLAALFPGLPVFALDITRDYQTETTRGGVTFAPASALGEIARRVPGSGLLASCGTFCCYRQDELQALFNEAHALGLDIAFTAPNAMGEGSLRRSLKRSRVTWFHPYLAMLRAAGFRLPENGGRQISFSESRSGESQTYIFAERLPPANMQASPAIRPRCMSA